jgi:hypothetical protein
VSVSKRAAAGALVGAGAIGAMVALLVTDRDPGHLPTVIATAIVALAVAAITAVTTDRRQERALEHQRLTLADELQAEEARLRARFAHERIMADLEELRSLLDEAAGHLAEAEAAESRYVSERDWLVNHKWPAEHGEADAFPVEAAEELLRLSDKRADAAHRAIASQERIAMRIGYDTPVQRHCWGAIHALMELWDVDQSDPGGEHRRDQLRAQHLDERKAFMDAARELIATAEEIAHPARRP